MASLFDRLSQGQWVVVAILSAYFALLAAIGGIGAWDRLGVPDIAPGFIDARSITSAWECDAEGIDVLPTNPCDPHGERPANYPSLWLLPSVLGLGQEATTPLGLLMVAAFLVSFLVLIRGSSAREGLVYGAAVVSPAVMLGVERANIDLFLFALLVSAAILFVKGGAARTCAHGVLLLAAMLKLYPVFAWGLLLRQERRAAAIGIIAMTALFGAYVLATMDTLRTIARVVPIGIESSYGADVGVDSLQAWAEGRAHLGAIAESGDALTAIAVLSAVALVIALSWVRRSARVGHLGRDDIRLAAFVIGTGIYAGSFATFQNWDYRLMFLLLAIPQLLAWAAVRAGPVPAPRATLVALIATLWLSEPLSTGVGLGVHTLLDPLTMGSLELPLDEILNWFLFVTLGVGLLLTTVVPFAYRRTEPSSPSVQWGL